MLQSKIQTAMPIRLKLLIPFLSIIAAAMLFTEELGFVNAKKALQTQISSKLALICRDKRDLVLEFFTAKKNIAKNFASDGLIRNELERLTRPADNSKTAPESPVMEAHLRRSKQPQDASIISIHVLDLQGRVISATGDTHSTKVRSAFEAFVRSDRQQVLLQYVPLPERRTAILVAATRLSSVAGDKELGVLVNVYALGLLSGVLSGNHSSSPSNPAINNASTIEPTVRSYLIDPTGQIIADSDVLPQTVNPSKFLDSGRSVERRAGLDDELVWLAKERIPLEQDQEWVVVVEQNDAAMIAPIIQLRRLSVITVFITLAVVAFLALSIARSISQPIQRLVTGTEKIGQGDLGHRVGTSDQDEVGVLSRAIDQMARHLQSLVGQHRQAEADVRALNETLEQRVAERTAEAESRAAELDHANAELIQTNKELDDFAYVASHDLRSPLRAIDNLAKWIAEDERNHFSEESRGDVATLRQRVDRMDALLDGLLQYSRIGRKRYNAEVIDTRELVCAISEFLDRPQELAIEVAEEMPTLSACRVPLEQVLRNLIDNAIKHHDRPGGRIAIAARHRDGFIEFSVADDGPGIAVQYHQQIFQIFQIFEIFEIFETLKSRDQVEGSGMGLALVKKTVETHGGQISLESAAGKGSTFRFTWPRNA